MVANSCAITGHRPEKLPNVEWVVQQLSSIFMVSQPSQVMVGMAAGVDLIAGSLAIDSGFPVVAVKPWAGHFGRVDDWALYRKVEEQATEVISVDPSLTYPGPSAYFRRNEYMVDNSDFIVAVWDGSKKSGTGACVEYALRKEKRVYRIDPKRLVAGWMGETDELPYDDVVLF